jgi:hypothetical protein
MSLDKAIASGKEHREPFRKSKRFDATCRNHGACPWCRGNRTHKYKRQEPSEEIGGYDVSKIREARSVYQREQSP